MEGPVPQLPQYELVAQINKTKGMNGQLVAHELDELSVLRPGLEVWIVPPTMEGVRRTTILEAQDDFKKRGVLIRLEGIDHRTQASELPGRYLLAHKDQVAIATRVFDMQLDEAEDETITEDYLREQCATKQGMAFVDTTNGSLGYLDSIKPGPAYDIWVLEGPYGKLEIPAVADYIIKEEVDLITLNLPKGFVEIVTGKDVQSSAHED